jgi:hypothetical protein
MLCVAGLLGIVLCALVSVRGNQCGFGDCGDDGCVKNQCCNAFGMPVGGLLCCGDRNINENQACGAPATGVCKERVCMSGRCTERNATAGTKCVFTPPVGVCELQATCDGNGNCVKPNVLVSPGVQCSTSTCSGTCSGASDQCICATTATATSTTVAVPSSATTTTTRLSASPTVPQSISISSSTAAGAATIPEEVTDSESETDSAPPDAASDAMPWLVPLLIALGVAFVVAVLVAVLVALRKKSRRAQTVPQPQTGVSLGTYAPVPAAPAGTDYSNAWLHPEFQSARDGGSGGDGRVYDKGELSGGF